MTLRATLEMALTPAKFPNSTPGSTTLEHQPKTLAFLTSESFPLSPNSVDGASRYPSVLDVGTGNGSTLLALRLKGGYQGLMVGN